MKEAIENITPEEIEKYFPSSKIPEGWISIEEHLPMMRALDVMQGYTQYSVRYEDGTEGISTVSDHNTWKYYAKEVGITHWFNDKGTI